MTWAPAGYDGSCTANSSSQALPLTLMCFLINYFGGSNDEILKDIYADQDTDESDYDFVIVGAGSAGCVVANRLSEQSNWTVLLLEAGDEEPRAADVPGLVLNLRASNIDYDYRTNDTRPQSYSRGKAMGGSSTINGMIYARGAKADYDDWASNGNTGWSWDEVLPYFKKSENARDPQILANYSQYHGTSGPLIVEQFPVEDKYTSVFIEAFEEAGLEETDYNKGDQIGVNRLQFTSVHGSRLSSNGAFVRSIRGNRSNLVVRPRARVTRIVIDATTKRATGVEYELTSASGEVTKKTANAAKEVIVSAGFIDSPKLLMLSGVGPKDDLLGLNITVIEDLPVGQNLREQYRVVLPLVTSNNVSTTSDTEMESQLLDWLNTHEGPMSAKDGISIMAFYQSKYENQSGAADFQFNIFGGGEQADGTLGNVTIAVSLVRPDSMGSVKLNSVDPLNSQPDIRIDAFSDPRDVEVFLAGLKFALKVADAQALKNAGSVLSTTPAAGCESYDIYGDDYMRCFVESTADNAGHGSGTCKMGPADDSSAVVDPQLKVRGVAGLRVVDASIMPRVVRSNINAPTIMIGEKGSDMIKNDWL